MRAARRAAGQVVHRFALAGLAVAGLGWSAGNASAQITPGDITIDLKPVGIGMVSPILGVDPRDGTNRMFIVDQTGKILIMQNGRVLPVPFLDISNIIAPLNAGYDEKGLLGIAFHPDYAHNGRFFVRYSQQRQGSPEEPCFGTPRGCHEEILAEFHVSRDPNLAIPDPTILFRVNKPEFNHNSGDVVFGADGYLYFTLGDGGGANDDLNLPNLPHGPIGNAQNTNVPLGKVLRIDIDHPSGTRLYGIPSDNPFANGGGLPEVWAYGLRNPYRFSFDWRPGGDGRMWLTDVGQDQTEELNIGMIGANYGWAVMEGPHCFDPFHTTTPPPSCNNTGMIPPVASYDHNVGGIAIVGGFVYRGSAVPELRGKYVFGDFSASFGAPGGRLYYIDTAGPLANIREFRIGRQPHPLGLFLKGFGQDPSGELYVMASGVLGPSGSGGEIMQIVSCYANCDGSTGSPVLNVDDFVCFMSKFASGDPAANCDLSVRSPALNVNDFVCFMLKYAGGCD